MYIYSCMCGCISGVCVCDCTRSILVNYLCRILFTTFDFHLYHNLKLEKKPNKTIVFYLSYNLIIFITFLWGK